MNRGGEFIFLKDFIFIYFSKILKINKYNEKMSKRNDTKKWIYTKNKK
jgi:hypothetical protein